MKPAIKRYDVFEKLKVVENLKHNLREDISYLSAFIFAFKHFLIWLRYF